MDILNFALRKNFESGKQGLYIVDYEVILISQRTFRVTGVHIRPQNQNSNNIHSTSTHHKHSYPWDNAFGELSAFHK